MVNVRLRSAMIEEEVTQVEAADILGIEVGRVNRIVCGRVRPTWDEMMAFSEILGRPADELFPDFHTHELSF